MSTPNLTNWACGLNQGSTYKLEALAVGSWWTIGKAEPEEISPSEVSFSGNYDKFGFKGTFDLSIKVTGDNVGQLCVNGKCRPCTFDEAGKYLYINFNQGGKSEQLALECWEGGLWIGGDGVPSGHHLWIGK